MKCESKFDLIQLSTSFKQQRLTVWFVLWYFFVEQEVFPSMQSNYVGPELTNTLFLSCIKTTMATEDIVTKLVHMINIKKNNPA